MRVYVYMYVPSYHCVGHITWSVYMLWASLFYLVPVIPLFIILEGVARRQRNAFDTFFIDNNIILLYYSIKDEDSTRTGNQ